LRIRKVIGKCKRCGKGGFFHRVNKSGLCDDCERIEMLQAKQDALTAGIEQYKKAYQDEKKKVEAIREECQKEEAALYEIKEKRELVYK
jgi:predicted RNase H-like nuclease (RuvC/YqgF family)